MHEYSLAARDVDQPTAVPVVPIFVQVVVHIAVHPTIVGSTGRTK